MRNLFSKSLFSYTIGTLILFIIAGGILSLTTNNYVVLISVFVIIYIIFILVLLYFHDQFIKPIEKANNVIDQLVKGNYRSRIHHPANGPFGILSSKINDLARNLSELSIQEQMQAEQLSTVIDNTESGIVLIDEKGFIHLVNRKFIEMFGNLAKDYIGYLYYDVLDNEKIHQIVQETFLYEKNIKGSFTYDNHVKKHYEIVGAPIFNDRNSLKGAVLVFYDITELKNLERMRRDFIANVSHELEVPVGLLATNSEQLLDGTIASDEKNNLIEDIRRESVRLELLLRDLLTLTKLEKDNFQLNVIKINMSQLVEEALEAVKNRIDQMNITLNVMMDDDQTLIGDFNKVKQIVINLLTNAASYSYKNGEISLTIEEVEGFLQIQVADKGIGISEKNLPRIFERFYRVDEARSKNSGGTGLGLAIVKHITEVHDGQVNVESEINKGTTFSVYLPLNRD